MSTTSTAQDASNGGGNGRQPHARARRVLMFPLPFQGHINPMLQLADVLHGPGLAVTILHYTGFRNTLDPALRPEFGFVAVPDGVPADVVASGNVVSMIVAMNTAMEASVAFRDVLAGERMPRAACLFVDSSLFGAQKAAEELGLPTIALRTGSAACFNCILAYPMLHQNGYLPPEGSQLDMPVKELPPLRVRDLFLSSRADHDMLSKFLAKATHAARSYSALVLNTFEALETDELEKIRDEIGIAMVLATGPLHRLSSKTEGTAGRSSNVLPHEDHTCIEWLDTQITGSVLYVSVGSLACMDSGELSEVAWGLANSGQPFLWVVRQDLVPGSDGPCLPKGFDDMVTGRGRVTPWAPQQEVLAHRAVGGFWTHNGWNSTLESVAKGCPMICRPQFADQMMNARYVDAVWGIGFELEGELERNKIGEAILKLMKGSEGEAMRKRAGELKKTVASCFESGGSSLLAINELIDHVSSL
ncbi:DIMBOA UDP-glucosyltransferase BX8-like [Triticum dicoccoides]|uniref:DIMBOA UDP-glucosyltransferase BX8-like n=1 Tax=Triticum dicoccoides TaxID=85692 RepID=UPI001890E879|nr:DIMBOA UDP-glucosyltransferase BX8-like [Triticum dicoccoides]